jgi:Stress responsive A/B Barrel Domain
MLVHVVLFDFKADVDPGRREVVLDLARKALVRIPGVSNLLAGKSIRKETEYPFALSMYFESEAALNIYRDHPDHVKFRDVDFFPLLEKVQGLDYED